MSNKQQLQINNTNLDALIARVNVAKDTAASLPEASGVNLPELTNEGTASDLMLNKELIDSNGEKVTGTFTIDEELNTQDDLIAQIQTLVSQKASPGGGDDPFKGQSPFSYSVNDVSGASYGFLLNGAGYYESQNKGVNSSYAICRVNFNVTTACDIIFDVINYAESGFDYAVFGALDTALALSNSADSTEKENFKRRQSPSVVNVTYSGVTVGSHYIDIKFIKDGTQNSNNDSVQFKVQEQAGSLSQETIDKILAADTDLVSENIKSGVDIFGVIGTYEGSGGSGGGTVETCSVEISCPSSVRFYYTDENYCAKEVVGGDRVTAIKNSFACVVNNENIMLLIRGT